MSPARIALTRRLLGSALLLLGAEPAFADCTADTTGLVVTCSGTSAAYTNIASGVSLSAASGATVTGPVMLGNNATVTNAGTINAAAGSSALRVGSQSTITNNSVLTSTLSTAGSSAATLGDYSTLINNGTLTALAGTQVATFGQGGTFINNAAATAATTGNVVFGPNLGPDVATFSNLNTTYGYSGNVTSSGNTNFTNAGPFTGAVTQTALSGGAVTITNNAGATFTGSLTTGDATTLNNAGTMTLTGLSTLGSDLLAGSNATNSGTLVLGTTALPQTLTVNGSYTQTAAGTLSIPLIGSTTGVPVAGTSYSQLYVAGTNGTATLAGTLALSPVAAFYPTGSRYDVVIADKAISGTFSAITGNSLPFISFVPVGTGVVTLASGQQAYELQAVRTTTYAAALAGAATANQIAIATGFQPLVATATAAPTGDAAALVGAADGLTVAQAQVFFDSLSPAGYLAYANAMRDQTNLFQRQVALRMLDQNSAHAERGWWIEGLGQFDPGSVGAYTTKESAIGLNGGYDFSAPNFVGGAAIGYSSDGLKYGSGAMSGHNTATTLGLYGAYHLGPLVAGGQLDYQFGHLSAARTIAVGTATRTANGSANDHLMTATGTLGIEAKFAGWALAPFGGIEYAKGAISGFAESGAGTANLTVGRIGADRTDLLAGVNYHKATGHWQPYVKATYRSQMGTGAGSQIAGMFNGDATTAFVVNGKAAGRHELDLDAGLNVVFDDEGTIFIGYQGMRRDDLHTHGLMAGLRLEF